MPVQSLEWLQLEGRNFICDINLQNVSLCILHYGPDNRGIWIRISASAKSFAIPRSVQKGFGPLLAEKRDNWWDVVTDNGNET